MENIRDEQRKDVKGKGRKKWEKGRIGNVRKLKGKEGTRREGKERAGRRKGNKMDGVGIIRDGKKGREVKEREGTERLKGKEKTGRK